MKKGIMIHYLPQHGGVDYTKYKETVNAEHPEFKHLFFPSNSREGVEVMQMPEEDNENKKVL